MYMKYFLDTIKHLVCCKMCSKNFENRLTNKKVLDKNILKIGISCTKISCKGGKYFPAFFKFSVFCNGCSKLLQNDTNDIPESESS